MTLTVDTFPIDISEWETEDSMAEEFLYTVWGIRPGVSSPRPTALRIDPACHASAAWLTALWGFSI
jgi:hypothetical protein